MAMGALAYSDLRLPWFLAMLIGLAVGTFIGFFNGICITRLKMKSLIETLSMMIILQGALLARTQGKTLTNLSDGYVWIEEATIGGWPIMPVVFLVALAARQGFCWPAGGWPAPRTRGPAICFTRLQRRSSVASASLAGGAMCFC